MHLEHLRKFATERQLECLDAWDREGSQGRAAKSMGIDKRTLERSIQRLKTRCAMQGISPEHDMVHEVPMPYMVKGTSTLYDRDGLPVQQWVKTSIDREQLAIAIEAFTAGFIEEVKPISKIKAPTGKLDKDIIPWLQIGDAHIGLLTHYAEVNHNFDIKIGSRELLFAAHSLIDQAPDCERFVIQDCGDFTHYQDFKGESESGHRFDFDTRYPKMIEAAGEIMRSIVDKALSKFKYVDVILNQGNHSRSNDIWMRVFLNHVYQKNTRLNVLKNSNIYIPYRMGNTFVMCNHGDKCKPNQLASVMATDYAKDWGESKYRYIDIGHIHHRMVAKEIAGVTIESWNQLAPSDKYAHDGGWRSRSCLSIVLRSKTYGEKGRITLTAEEVKDRISKLEPGTTAMISPEVYSV